MDKISKTNDSKNNKSNPSSDNKSRSRHRRPRPRRRSNRFDSNRSEEPVSALKTTDPDNDDGEEIDGYPQIAAIKQIYEHDNGDRMFLCETCGAAMIMTPELLKNTKSTQYLWTLHFKTPEHRRKFVLGLRYGAFWTAYRLWIDEKFSSPMPVIARLNRVHEQWPVLEQIQSDIMDSVYRQCNAQIMSDVLDSLCFPWSRCTSGFFYNAHEVGLEHMALDLDSKALVCTLCVEQMEFKQLNQHIRSYAHVFNVVRHEHGRLAYEVEKLTNDRDRRAAIAKHFDEIGDGGVLDKTGRQIAVRSAVIDRLMKQQQKLNPLPEDEQIKRATLFYMILKMSVQSQKTCVPTAVLDSKLPVLGLNSVCEIGLKLPDGSQSRCYLCQSCGVVVTNELLMHHLRDLRHQTIFLISKVSPQRSKELAELLHSEKFDHKADLIHKLSKTTRYPPEKHIEKLNFNLFMSDVTKTLVPTLSLPAPSTPPPEPPEKPPPKHSTRPVSKDADKHKPSSKPAQKPPRLNRVHEQWPVLEQIMSDVLDSLYFPWSRRASGFFYNAHEVGLEHMALDLDSKEHPLVCTLCVEEMEFKQLNQHIRSYAHVFNVVRHEHGRLAYEVEKLTNDRDRRAAIAKYFDAIVDNGGILDKTGRKVAVRSAVIDRLMKQQQKLNPLPEEKQIKRATLFYMILKMSVRVQKTCVPKSVLDSKVPMLGLNCISEIGLKLPDGSQSYCYLCKSCGVIIITELLIHHLKELRHQAIFFLMSKVSPQRTKELTELLHSEKLDHRTEDLIHTLLTRMRDPPKKDIDKLNFDLYMSNVTKTLVPTLCLPVPSNPHPETPKTPPPRHSTKPIPITKHAGRHNSSSKPPQSSKRPPRRHSAKPVSKDAGGKHNPSSKLPAETPPRRHSTKPVSKDVGGGKHKSSSKPAQKSQSPSRGSQTPLNCRVSFTLLSNKRTRKLVPSLWTEIDESTSCKTLPKQRTEMLEQLQQPSSKLPPRHSTKPVCKDAGNDNSSSTPPPPESPKPPPMHSTSCELKETTEILEQLQQPSSKLPPRHSTKPVCKDAGNDNSSSTPPPPESPKPPPMHSTSCELKETTEILEQLQQPSSNLSAETPPERHSTKPISKDAGKPNPPSNTPAETSPQMHSTKPISEDAGKHKPSSNQPAETPPRRHSTKPGCKDAGKDNCSSKPPPESPKPPPMHSTKSVSKDAGKHKPSSKPRSKSPKLPSTKHSTKPVCKDAGNNNSSSKPHPRHSTKPVYKDAGNDNSSSSKPHSRHSTRSVCKDVGKDNSSSNPHSRHSTRSVCKNAGKDNSSSKPHPESPKPHPRHSTKSVSKDAGKDNSSSKPSPERPKTPPRRHSTELLSEDAGGKHKPSSKPAQKPQSLSASSSRKRALKCLRSTTSKDVPSAKPKKARIELDECHPANLVVNLVYQQQQLVKTDMETQKLRALLLSNVITSPVQTMDTDIPDLSHCDAALVGTEFICEVLHNEGGLDVVSCFVCKLCGWLRPSSKLIDHLLSAQHRFNSLKSADGALAFEIHCKLVVCADANAADQLLVHSCQSLEKSEGHSPLNRRVSFTLLSDKRTRKLVPSLWTEIDESTSCKTLPKETPEMLKQLQQLVPRWMPVLIGEKNSQEKEIPSRLRKRAQSAVADKLLPIPLFPPAPNFRPVSGRLHWDGVPNNQVPVSRFAFPASLSATATTNYENGNDGRTLVSLTEAALAKGPISKMGKRELTRKRRERMERLRKKQKETMFPRPPNGNYKHLQSCRVIKTWLDIGESNAGISIPVTAAVFHSIFELFGEVLRIVTYGCSNADAFVEFADAAAAHNAIRDMNGKVFKGCRVNVEYSYKKTIDIKFINKFSMDYKPRKQHTLQSRDMVRPDAWTNGHITVHPNAQPHLEKFGIRSSDLCDSDSHMPEIICEVTPKAQNTAMPKEVSVTETEAKPLHKQVDTLPSFVPLVLLTNANDESSSDWSESESEEEQEEEDSQLAQRNLNAIRNTGTSPDQPNHPVPSHNCGSPSYLE